MRLAVFARHASDAVVNLGDRVSRPLAAAATADLLIERAFVTVRGNHDRQLLDRPSAAMGPSDRAADVAARLGATGDRRLVVNPGSVGLPAFAADAPFPHAIEAGSPHARYAAVDTGPRPPRARGARRGRTRWRPGTPRAPNARRPFRRP